MTRLTKVDRRDSQRLWAPVATAVHDTRVGFTPLQWSVILFAPQEPLASIRPAGRVRRFVRWLLGETHGIQLANPHLETLRRTALLAWHGGFKVPANDLSEFLAAGFSHKQFDLMIGALSTHLAPNRKFAR